MRARQFKKMRPKVLLLLLLPLLAELLSSSLEYRLPYGDFARPNARKSVKRSEGLRVAGGGDRISAALVDGHVKVSARVTRCGEARNVACVNFET